LLFILPVGADPVPAQDAPAQWGSLSSFERIPILFGGRVMPIDSYARNVLLQFSGRRTLGRKPSAPASAWLAQTFFAPEQATSHPIFLINHPDVAQALGLEPEEKRRYALDQLHPALDKLETLAGAARALEEDARSPVETEILRLYQNVGYFSQLLRCFQFALPIPGLRIQDDVLRKRLNLPEGREITYLDLFQRADVLQDLLTGTLETEPSDWTPTEQQAFRLSSILYHGARGNRNLEVTMVPADPHGQQLWMSPWDALSLDPRDTGLRNALISWGRMANAYRSGRQTDFDQAAGAYRQFAESRIKDDRARSHLDVEVAYNRYALFSRAGWLYGFAFLVSFLGFVTERRWLSLAGAGLAALGLGPHCAGIVMRMMIMGRPPVTNLYATFLFVGAVCVGLGLLVEALQRNGLGQVAASFSGLSLLLVAERFFDDGDTLHRVVAVLDSNFWLSTHVITITIGYAGCVVAGFIGHIYLLQTAFAPADTGRRAASYRAMIGLLAFGLTFSFLGTMLGGVWADHSWGRFWGWDPKENGALLIVLWCAILFHARLGRLIGDVGMAAGCVIGVVVVLMAWLGVNLLSVGLHSYGFTSGWAGGFFAAVAFEVVFVTVLGPLSHRSLQRTSMVGTPVA
jgi:ABC-type transport system involved in cytochrome c biogenesis permease subunit